MWIGSSQNPNLYMFRKLLKEEKGDNRSDWANNKFPFSIWDYLMMKFERIQLGCNWVIWRRTFRNLSTLTAKSIVTYNSSNLVNNNMNGLVICWNTSTWNMSTMIYKWHFEEKRTVRQCDSKATFFLSPTVSTQLLAWVGVTPIVIGCSSLLSLQFILGLDLRLS